MFLPDSYLSTVSDHHWFYGNIHRTHKPVARWFIDSSGFKNDRYWEKSLEFFYKANYNLPDGLTSAASEQVVRRQ